MDQCLTLADSLVSTSLLSLSLPLFPRSYDTLFILHLSSCPVVFLPRCLLVLLHHRQLLCLLQPHLNLLCQPDPLLRPHRSLERILVAQDSFLCAAGIKDRLLLLLLPSVLAVNSPLVSLLLLLLPPPAVAPFRATDQKHPRLERLLHRRHRKDPMAQSSRVFRPARAS